MIKGEKHNLLLPLRGRNDRSNLGFEIATLLSLTREGCPLISLGGKACPN